MREELCTDLSFTSLSPLSLTDTVNDVTLGAIDHWQGTRAGAGGTATLLLNIMFLHRWEDFS